MILTKILSAFYQIGLSNFSVYFYPIFLGQLDMHQDPPKQSLVGMINLSEFNDEYNKGGLYIIKNNTKFHIDRHLSVGDAYLLTKLISI